MTLPCRAPTLVAWAIMLILSPTQVMHAQSAEEKATASLAEALLAREEGPRLLAWKLAADLATPGLETAARVGTESPDRVERSLALELLAHIDVPRNRDTFAKGLDSPYRSVRLRAMRALATLHDPQLAVRFAQVLAEDPDPDLRALAALALGAIDAVESEPALRKGLLDPHPVVQEAAVRGLVARGETGIGVELLERARGTDWPETTRLLGLVALVPDRAVLPRLTELLDDPTPVVRVAAAAAILHLAEAGR